MSHVQRCPRCAALTMLTRCPSCRVPCAPYCENGSVPLRVGFNGAVTDTESAGAPSDGHRAAGVAHTRSNSSAGDREASLSATVSPADVTIDGDDDDARKTREELLEELRAERVERGGLLRRIQALTSENRALAARLQREREHMVASAADVLDLHKSVKAMRGADCRAAEQLLRDIAALRREQELLEIPARLSSTAPSTVDVPPRQQPQRHARPATEDLSVSDITLNSGRRTGEARLQAAAGVTPISITVDPLSGRQNGDADDDGESAEVARLRRIIREKDRQLRQITARVERAERVVMQLDENLDGVQRLASASEQILSTPTASLPSPQLEDVGDAPPVARQYEAMLYRSGSAPYSRRDYRAGEGKSRQLPSSYAEAGENSNGASVRTHHSESLVH